MATDTFDTHVTAVSKATGRKARIPRAWLDHPVLGKGWKLPPSARTAKPVGDPTTGDGSDAPPSTTTPPETNQTPASGEEE